MEEDAGKTMDARLSFTIDANAYGFTFEKT
jgi:hypothetical protein